MTKKFLPLIFALALSLSVFAQQSGTMFIHQGQTVLEFSISDVDSIVFYRAQDELTPPIIFNTQIDDAVIIRDAMEHRLDYPIILAERMDTVTINRTTHIAAVPAQWFTSLGRTTFATDNTWTIVSRNGAITQIWSDAVQAENCNKTSFSGGYLYGDSLTLKVDCRSNPGFPGDLFSWLAVYELRDELCPYPWRVPTREDFIDLDVALGGTGDKRGGDREFVMNNFINRWGGAFGGGSGPTGVLWHQSSWGDYWSKTEEGFYLGFGILGTVSPRNFDSQRDGLALRCIRR
ncbi:MAG: fibrobacter succinogenes major paralogous domain-containing protein [Bacteroidales bacterium]|nr:fibrobacter succinogenes major paralogous domain-containing protein [Bacteroidales bacterium]